MQTHTDRFTSTLTAGNRVKIMPSHADDVTHLGVIVDRSSILVSINISVDVNSPAPSHYEGCRRYNVLRDDGKRVDVQRSRLRAAV